MRAETKEKLRKHDQTRGKPKNIDSSSSSQLPSNQWHESSL